MAISTSGMFVDALRQYRLLTADQLARLPQLAQGRSGHARSLAKALVQRSWLTVYQINQLLAGRADELVIGPYHVQDRLGQGGLSAVYLARHQEHRNLVAIKIIKPEVFADPAGRSQFLQEVEAMARLDHPNIVQFCDADQWRDTHYFAMEYVEGTDLGKVVRLSGALPVTEACDFVRQAALGLQHAYERNLVHRDIKPVNLFLTHTSTGPRSAPTSLSSSRPSSKLTIQLKPLIKILDWGLAYLRIPTGQAGVDENDRGIIGTVDYLAPEQARSAHTVDTRGDIYSLGCTLYYLLTSQAPFPDGTLMQKIMAHQTAQAKPIAEFRNDVPADVIAVVERMMAKEPADRFQTPASAALALLPFTRRASLQTGSSAMLPTLRGKPSRTGRDDTPLPPTTNAAKHSIDAQ